MPFENLSGDANQDFIADGLSENIIASLSKIPEMIVSSRNNTFVYKGKHIKAQQVAEELAESLRFVALEIPTKCAIQHILLPKNIS